MSVSSTEGKTFYGIVVGGFDTLDKDAPPPMLGQPPVHDEVDPYGLGRVKVLCPSLHHITTPYKDLPWCYMASDASGIGAYSFNRPPPPGSVVEISFSPGTKATGQGVIRSVILGVHNPEAKGGKDSKIVSPTAGGRGENLATNIKGFIHKARNAETKTCSGPARSFNGGGAKYFPHPSMQMREGFDNSLASKATIMPLRPIHSIVTAEMWEAFSFPGGISGESALVRQHGDFFGRLFEDDDPFLEQAIKSACINIMNGYETSPSPVNYAAPGSKTMIVGWRRLAAKELTDRVKNQKTLNDVFQTIMSADFLSKAMEQCGEKKGEAYWISNPLEYSYPRPDTGNQALNSMSEQDEDLEPAMEYNKKDLLKDECEPLQPIQGNGGTVFGNATVMFKPDGQVMVADGGGVTSEKAEYIKETLWKIPTARAGLTGCEYEAEGLLKDKKGLYLDDAGIIDALLKLKIDGQTTLKTVLDDIKGLAAHNQFCRFMEGEGIARGAAKGGNIKGSS